MRIKENEIADEKAKKYLKPALDSEIQTLNTSKRKLKG